MRVQVRLWDLVSARCVWLSVKMSVVVSRPVSQSANFEESCPLNVGISWGKDMVRFAFLCLVAQGSGEWNPWEQGHPQCHDFHILLSWCGFCFTFQGCLAEPSGVTVCGHRTCACYSGWAGYKRQKSLTRQWLCSALLGWSSFVYCEGLAKALSVKSYQWSGEHLNHLPAGIFHCSTARSLIVTQV